MGGRWASLAVYSARTGVIDYSKEDTKNINFRLKEEWFFQSIETEQLLKGIEIKAQLLSSIEPVKALDMLDDIMNIRLPWLKETTLNYDDLYNAVIRNTKHG